MWEKYESGKVLSMGFLHDLAVVGDVTEVDEESNTSLLGFSLGC